MNLIVQASRLQDGSRRMVSITEVTGMEGEVISMQEVFRYQRVGLTPDNKIIGHFTATGVRSHYSERFRMWGYDLPLGKSSNPSRRSNAQWSISAEPLIYGLIFLAVLASCAGHLSDGLRQVDLAQQPGQPPAWRCSKRARAANRCWNNSARR